MSFEIKEDFNKEEPSHNLAICYKVKKGFEFKADDMDEKNHIFWLNYDPRDKTGRKEIDITEKNYRFFPVIESSTDDNIQNSRIILFGKSGSGKSSIINRMAQIFHSQNKDLPIYFITNNNAKDDPALTPKSMYTFINVNKLINMYSDKKNMSDFKTGRNDGDCFNNSLIIFDDISLEEDKKSLVIFHAFANVCATHKRKARIHYIFSTHDTSNIYTKILYKEATHYILFNFGLTNRCNYILEEKFKMTKAEIDKICDNEDSRHTVIFVDKKIVMAQNRVYKLK